LADLTDRHYALFANNQHPLQLDAYEEYNKFLRSVHSKEERASDEALGERFDEITEDRRSRLNTNEGESLSIDDMSDIYMQAMGEHRAKTNMSLATKTKTGEINDYLEVRRPFGAAQ
jgi:hypothetical protein